MLPVALGVLVLASACEPGHVERSEGPSSSPVPTSRTEPVAGVCRSGPARAPISPGRIAYGRAPDDGDTTEIVVARPDGSNQVVVWNRAQAGRQFTADAPKFSPDGKSLVFTVYDKKAKTTAMTVVDVDGGGKARRLTPDADHDYDPVFSPDGRCIAFVRDERVYVVVADGTGQPLPVTAGPHDGQPAWSPDGERIVYTTTDPASKDKDDEGLDKTRLVTSRADGGGGTTVLTPYHDAMTDTTPSWSSDGRTIVFQRTSSAGGPLIWLIPSGGGMPRRLTRTPGWETEFTPAFSSDGRSVILLGYVAEDPEQEEGGDDQFDLYRIGIDGSPRQRITFTDDSEEFPTWVGAG